MRRLGVLVLLVGLVGCGKPSEPPERGEPQGSGAETATPAESQPASATPEAPARGRQVLVFNNGAEPKSLDPAIVTGVPEHTLLLGIFEGLTTHDPETLEPIPGVAREWTVSDDGLVYTFHLRDDARWVNSRGEVVGTVTADDFVYSWRRAVDPTTAAEYAYQLWYVEGAEAITKGQVTEDTPPFGATAPDPQTLVVKLRAPCAYFLDLCCFETLMPVHPPTLEAMQQEAERRKEPLYVKSWVLPEHIVTNGPFCLAEWKPKEVIVMRKNPHYWDADTVKLEEVRALPLDDMDTAYSLYQAGKVDWLRAIPLPKIDEIKQDPDYFVTPYLGTYYYSFNVTHPPYDQFAVRMAFNLAINKKRLCEEVLKAGQTPATGFVPPGIPGYPEFQGRPYDPDEARRLLHEAGYRVPGIDQGKEFPQVELLYNTSEAHKTVAEVVAQMWKEVLGVKVSLANREWQVYQDTVTNLDYQIARRGWIGDYTDPNTFMDMFVTDGGNNKTGWSSVRYDELIEQAARELDPEKRFGMFQDAERILCVEELPLIPIYYYVNQGMVRPRVQGIVENIRDLHPFKFIWIDESAEE